MSDEVKDVERIAAAINVEDFRLVKLSIQALEKRPKASQAVYIGVITQEGPIWYEPTLEGMILADMPEEAARDLDTALAQWDAAKAAGTLQTMSPEQLTSLEVGDHGLQ